MGRKSGHADSIRVGDVLLPSVLAAEARDSTGNNHHEADRDSSNDEEQLQVDLTVLAGKPLITVAGHCAGLEDTLAVPVAEFALSGGAAADPAGQGAAVRSCGQVQVTRHAGACVGALRVLAGGAVRAVVVLSACALVKVVNGDSGDGGH